MVNTVKISTFPSGALNNSGRTSTGVTNSANTNNLVQNTWTTGTRPSAPFDGLMGYNTSLEKWEYWDNGALDWVFFTTNSSQFLSSEVDLSPGVSLTTNTDTDITSLPLTEGEWFIWGSVCYFGDASTNFLIGIGWISTVSATRPAPPLYNTQSYAPSGSIGLFNTNEISFSVIEQQLTIASPTTVYLGSRASFTVNTCVGGGTLYARRV